MSCTTPQAHLADPLVGVSRTQRSDVFVTTIARRPGPGRLFGGHVAAQAVSAACATVATDRPLHSLHAYFLSMGTPGEAIEYAVTRSRDGRGFSSRHVSARQGGRVVFEMLASFQHPEPGHDWQAQITDVGAPPEQRSDTTRFAGISHRLDIRPVAPGTAEEWRIHPYWFRADPPVGTDPALNAALLTYVSDLALMANAREPGSRRPMAVAASLDHAVWLHRIPRVDEWLLYSTEPVAHVGTRGMVRGTMHDLGGRLVASVMQEALLRPANEHPVG